MAGDTTTAHYGWTKPEPHASTSSWGDKLNSDLDMIDQKVFDNANASGSTLTSKPSTSVKATLTFLNGEAPAGQQTRWVLAEDTVAESGAQAGSNFTLAAYSDGGTVLSTPLAITRSTGQVSINTAAVFNSTAYVAGAVSFNSTLGVTGAATFAGAVVCNTTLRATGTATFNGATVCNSTLFASGAVSFGGTLGVTGLAAFGAAATVATTLTVGGAAAFNTGATVSGAPLAVAAGANPTLILEDGGLNNRGYLFFDTANGRLQGVHTASGGFFRINSDATFEVGSGTAYKPGGGSWTAPSDERIKTVVEDYEAGLDEVTQLRPVVYTYKGNDTFLEPPEGETAPYPSSSNYDAAVAGTPFVGFVAQELEQVFPGMVSQREGCVDGVRVTDLRDVDVSALVYALVNSVKQLKAEIEALKAG